jgi:hypothetical protein
MPHRDSTTPGPAPDRPVEVDLPALRDVARLLRSVAAPLPVPARPVDLVPGLPGDDAEHARRGYREHLRATGAGLTELAAGAEALAAAAERMADHYDEADAVALAALAPLARAPAHRPPGRGGR